MILTNIDAVPGHRIVEHFGIVQGSTVRARHAGSDFAAGLKNLVGGELKGYTKLLEMARAESLERIEEQAQQLGANAIINVRFATSAISRGAAELMAYGTAVKVEQLGAGRTTAADGTEKIALSADTPTVSPDPITPGNPTMQSNPASNPSININTQDGISPNKPDNSTGA